MTPEDAFINDILENPEDDSLPLIWADWLEERDEHDRAQFLRMLGQSHEQGRLNVLLAAHSEDWVLFCGLPLTWENTVHLFVRRLSETVAWCRGRSVADLWHPALKPGPMFAQYDALYTPTPTAVRQQIVNGIANRRAQLLGETERLGSPPGGRLLLFDPDDSLSDGAAALESAGFFDDDNVPAGSTWVWYAEERRPGVRRWMPFASYLVAWVPPQLVEPADAAIRVNPEECIRWASDVDSRFTRKLREAGLLLPDERG